MTKAAGFYNSLVKLDQPAIVIEPLNGYRTKEKIPSNLGELETPIGEVDIIKKGKDLIVTAPTSSGKTESFLIPILEHIIQNPTDDVQAIFVYPAKALSNNQVGKILQYANII